MKRLFFNIAFAILALCLSTSCGNGTNDIKVPDTYGNIISVEFEYSFKMSPEILRYFDITAHYVNSENEIVSFKMTQESINVETSATNFPFRARLFFTVARNNTPAPVVAQEWQTEFHANVYRYFDAPFEDKSSSSSITIYPETETADFEAWAEKFTILMGLGYENFATVYGSVDPSY